MKPLLSVNNLTHLYAPGKGFSDVSFELWPGEVLGIVGESGSGKTTLLKSISARLAPQNGEILYEGASLYGMSEAERRRLLRTTALLLAGALGCPPRAKAQQALTLIVGEALDESGKVKPLRAWQQKLFGYLQQELGVEPSWPISYGYAVKRRAR